MTVSGIFRSILLRLDHFNKVIFTTSEQRTAQVVRFDTTQARTDQCRNRLGCHNHKRTVLPEGLFEDRLNAADPFSDRLTFRWTDRFRSVFPLLEYTRILTTNLVQAQPLPETVVQVLQLGFPLQWNVKCLRKCLS